MNTLFLLIAVHYLCDFPLQGDFLARNKTRFIQAPVVGWPDRLTVNPIWFHCLTAHSFIHGLGVYLITGSVILGLMEVVCHAIIDYLKGEGLISFDIDQGAHLGCKVFWWLCV